MTYIATRSNVLNRGQPSIDFLDQLVAWGKSAPEDIFEVNTRYDIYSSVKEALGPWRDATHRRAAMLEVMRVLAGFESSWNWSEGRDRNTPASKPPETVEAGAWQVSADSMNFGPELRALVVRHLAADDAQSFQDGMKKDHPLAMEYIARLLRRTTKANGPVKRHEIDPWLRRDAVEEFEQLLRL